MNELELILCARCGHSAAVHGPASGKCFASAFEDAKLAPCSCRHFEPRGLPVLRATREAKEGT